MPKLIRVTTVPMAFHVLLKGQMKYMKDAGFDVILVSADGRERDDVLQSEECPHVIIPMTRKITPFADLKSLWQLYRFFKKEKPDIVHSHTPKAGLLSMLAARMAGVKLRIHTIAGLRFMTSGGMTRKILTTMEKLTTSAATHVWPNSQSLLQYIKEQKLASPKKLEVIGKGSTNGINLERFSESSLSQEKIEGAKKVIRYDPGLSYILSIGRIVKDKGIAEVAKAFDKLYRKNTSLRLVLVGEFEEHLDPLDPQTMETIRNHPGIILAGWHDEVEYFLHLADVLVHASYREGFPNVLLQAGAMRCPIVCSRIPGNVDIVDNNQTGLIFKVRDEEDLYNKLEEAITSKDKMRMMAEHLRRKIEQNFDTRQVRRFLEEKYRLLLSEANKEKNLR